MFFGLKLLKASRKKGADVWFQRLRRRITRTIGYTVVLFLIVKFSAKLILGENLMDAVTYKIEAAIYGALKDFYYFQLHSLVMSSL